MFSSGLELSGGDRVLIDHVMRVGGLFGLSQTPEAAILFPVHIGHIRPGIDAEQLIDGRIDVGDFGIRLFYMDDGRFPVEGFSQRKSLHLTIDQYGSPWKSGLRKYVRAS